MKHIPERICVVIMLLLLAVGVSYVAVEHDAEVEKQKMMEALKQEFVSEPITEPEVEPEIVIPEPEVPAIIYCEPTIDFAGLQTENQDIYAWIQVPGTEIDYPVLQREEDNYYLNRNVDGSKGYPGCIYSNKCNAKDFSDFITVLYGHNMKNGTMFAGLHQFKEEDFFQNNRQMVVYTAEARYTYEICMAAAYNDSYLPAYFDVNSGQGAEQFRSSLEHYEDERKHIRTEMTETEEEKLLVLSTCIANEGTKRYLVVGKLIETALYLHE